MRGRWFRFGFAPPFGFWFRSAWRFPRREEYLRMLEEYREELEEDLGGEGGDREAGEGRRGGEGERLSLY